MYEIILLKNATTFINSVPVKMKAKILRTIDLLEKFGVALPMPHSKKLKGFDLHELRVKLSSDIVRLFYFHEKDRIYVITSGYIKKTDNTNRKEIERAIRLKAKYLEEN